MLPVNNIAKCSGFTEKTTGARGAERIKEAPGLRRLFLHFQPNLKSNRTRACRENANEARKKRKKQEVSDLG